MVDTLKNIAIDWKQHGLSDEEVRRRCSLLPPVVYHHDDTPYGDGGWIEGDARNTSTAVYALEGTVLDKGDAERFLSI